MPPRLLQVWNIPSFKATQVPRPRPPRSLAAPISGTPPLGPQVPLTVRAPSLPEPGVSAASWPCHTDRALQVSHCLTGDLGARSCWSFLLETVSGRGPASAPCHRGHLREARLHASLRQGGGPGPGCLRSLCVQRKPSNWTARRGAGASSVTQVRSAA